MILTIFKFHAINKLKVCLTLSTFWLGYLNHAEFEWNWYQHEVMLMPNGNLMLFDNGHYRNLDFSDFGNFSRAVEYEIDAQNKNPKYVILPL